MTLTFKETAEDIKEQLLWLMLENYKERIAQKALELNNEGEKKTG
ncbi:hypothetical protein SAMN02910447_03581 [Ruminococcus sp. YE71]|nr:MULTISPECIES: hypothetical protein [unclassified Ruminococcus]SDA32780.1 hypothetical protein SAMN02910446_03638 [Ruminococcus sp. YE78]SFW54118.1 hypothetical protein SAMN02910447_03581 [Ruminococcus sp. YE71]